ncbi:MAG TPA: SCO family protein [Paludibacter sp.]|nr:SCO family protein [Paludibacter sp.]
MKKTVVLLLFSLPCFGQGSFSQDEVGIYEHLGSKLPLDLKFVNEKFDTVRLGDLVTKPTILSFVYFDCPGLCSPLLEGLGDVIRKSDMVLGKDYQVITISFNFRDTPEKAKEKKTRFIDRYAKGKGENWMFLTTDSATIFRITNAAGFKVKAVGLDFVHPSAIIAVSPQGMITRYLYGITFLPLDFKMAIVEANKGQARPTVQKVLAICYSYDPQSNHFALDVTKIAGILVVFFMVIFALVFLLSSRNKPVKTKE